MIEDWPRVGFRRAIVDLAALRRNAATLQSRLPGVTLMAVLKSNAYGHGAVACARAATAAGVQWLCVADLQEAAELRAAGVRAPILAWLHGDHADWAWAIKHRVDVGSSSLAQLEAVAESCRALASMGDAGGAFTAMVQVKLDTGLNRNGVPPYAWGDVFARAAQLERAGVLRIRGVFSHLANTSPADDAAATTRFGAGLAAARAAGLRPELVHLAASAAALTGQGSDADLGFGLGAGPGAGLAPDADLGVAAEAGLRVNAVRLGLTLYGLSPLAGVTAADLGLSPVMRLESDVLAVHRAAPGSGVSYDYTHYTSAETKLALVGLGYADGVPRHASNTAVVQIRQQLFPVVGRVAMDQFVVDVGDATVQPGDPVVLFGDPARGEPPIEALAAAADTISYELLTRIGQRVQHTYVDAETDGTA